jgi:multidrug resistance efflux pump
MPSASGYPHPVEATTPSHDHPAPIIEIAPAQQHEPKAWKIARISVALPLIALSGGGLLPLAVVPVSTQAVVNARLSDVRAPIAGDLQEVLLETGDIVNANEPLAKLRAMPSTIAARRDTEERAIRELEAKVSDIESELAASQIQLNKANHTASSYATHLAQNLQLQLQTATKEQQDTEARLAQLNLEVTRDTQALADHLIPRSMLDEATERQARAQSDSQAASSALSHLQKQIGDVRGGYLLGSDSVPPVFLETRDEAAAQVARWTSEKDALEGQIADLRKDETGEVESAERAVVVRSPVTGAIWSRSVAPAQSVVEGDDLFRIADSGSIHVEVWLDRRYGPQLSIGDVALVYLGGMGKELTGRVISFQGSSRRRLDEEVNAIDLQPVHTDQYHVTIELDPADRNATYIGQAAKVIFPGGKGQLKSRIYSWLARL